MSRDVSTDSGDRRRGSCRSSPVCRGLAAGGYRVTAVAGKERAAAHWSRACSEPLVCPNPVKETDAFTHFLRHLVEQGDYDVLMHGGEGSLLAISKHRADYEPHVKVGLPPHDVVLRSLDRVALLAFASEVGLPPPESVVCADQDEAHSAAADLGFPLSLKPARSLLEIDGVLSHRSLTMLDSEADLSSALGQYRPPYILQRFLPGAPVLSCSGLWAGGRLVGVTTSRARRTYPAEAGTFTYVETVSPPPGVLAGVERWSRQSVGKGSSKWTSWSRRAATVSWISIPVRTGRWRSTSRPAPTFPPSGATGCSAGIRARYGSACVRGPLGEW